MRRLASGLWLAVVFHLTIVLFILGFVSPVWAGAVDGQQLFNSNCSACHIGGNNVIISHKTLKKDALEKYEMKFLEAIRNQVINGKNAMPSFKGRLSDEEIEAIAGYVLNQAEIGW